MQFTTSSLLCTNFYYPLRFTPEVVLPTGAKVSGGGLPVPYEAAQFHFHLGSIYLYNIGLVLTFALC